MKKSELKQLIREEIIATLSENQGGSSNDIKSKIEKMKNSPNLGKLVVIGTLNGREGEFYDFKNSMGNLVAYFNAYTGSNARSVPITKDNVKLTKIESSLEEAEQGVIHTKDQRKAEELAKKGLNVSIDERKKKEDDEEDVVVKDTWGKADDDDSFTEKEPTAKDLKKNSSMVKLQSKYAEVTKQMKALVNKYKQAPGEEKNKIVNQLKDLTKVKKELEIMITPSIEDDED